MGLVTILPSLASDYGLGDDHVDVVDEPMEYDAIGLIVLLYMMIAQGQYGYLEELRTAISKSLVKVITPLVPEHLTGTAIVPSLLLSTDVANMLSVGLGGTISSGSVPTDDQAAEVRTRYIAIAMYAMLLPGYRILNQYTPPMPPLIWPLSQTKSETLTSGWLSKFAPGAQRPYDIVLIAAHRYRTDQTRIVDNVNIWTPIRPLKSSNLITKGGLGLCPNIAPLPFPQDGLILPPGNSVNPFNVPILAGLAPPTGATSSDNARYVAAIMSDEPWHDHFTKSLDGTSICPRGSFSWTGAASGAVSTVGHSTTSIGEAFEAWFDERLTQVPTMRQALGTSLGFNL